MELFKVTIEYDDWEAMLEWHKQLEAAAKLHMHVEISFPERLRETTYAAVVGGFGYAMIENAAKIALEKVVGKGSETWKEFQAIVVSVESMGSIGVQELEGEQK